MKRSEASRSEVRIACFTKCLTFPFVALFFVIVYTVYELAVVVSFIVVFCVLCFEFV
jgi:hypothetical protein